MNRDVIAIPQLVQFYHVIKEDSRISATHISVYMALFIRWQDKGCEGPVCFRRTEVMETAKINGIATYHKCIKDLADFGYIRYVPSYNPAISNQAYLLE